MATKMSTFAPYELNFLFDYSSLLMEFSMSAYKEAMDSISYYTTTCIDQPTVDHVGEVVFNLYSLRDKLIALIVVVTLAKKKTLESMMRGLRRRSRSSRFTHRHLSALDDIHIALERMRWW